MLTLEQGEVLVPGPMVDSEIPQSALWIHGSAYTDPINPGSCTTVVFIRKNLPISGPGKLTPDQL